MTATRFVGDGSGVITTPLMTIENVQVTDASYTVLDDTALSTKGPGYVNVNGSGFAQGTVVLVDNSLVSSTTFVSSTQLRCQLAAKPAGTYSLSVVRLDSVTASLPVGITYSPFPVWSTSSTLVNVVKTVAFTQTLSATEPSDNITYAVADGSALPLGVTLSSSGVLDGNITTDPGNDTTYTFSIQAMDAQYQNIPRTFSLFATRAPKIAQQDLK
jgi:hypothetical protein